MKYELTPPRKNTVQGMNNYLDDFTERGRLQSDLGPGNGVLEFNLIDWTGLIILVPSSPWRYFPLFCDNTIHSLSSPLQRL